MPGNSHQEKYWEASPQEVLQKLNAKETGLTDTEVQKRQRLYGLNIINFRHINIFTIFLRQLTGNPLILILAFATFVSFSLGERVSSYYIFGIIVVSILLGLWNEYSAEKTIDNLLKKITPAALVVRNGEKDEVPVSHLTIGDIVLLSQGTIIPADLRLLEAERLEINESALTGESKTVFKTNKIMPPRNSVLADMKNIAFMGTIVESGSGKGVIIRIGKETEFGKVAKTTTFIKPVTEFQKGLASFGNMIIQIILYLTIAMFIINTLLGHHWLESVLFALAIAVGLTPELLPVIVTVSLSHGAGKLAKKHVVVKRLLSLEAFGNMDVLCTDKTGTLTEGKIDVVSYVNAQNKKDVAVLHKALICNSAIINHKVIGNAIDTALWEHALREHIMLDSKIKKIHEEAFDYNQKLQYTVAREEAQISLYVKGAPEAVLPLCKNLRNKRATEEELSELRKNGYRVIAIAAKHIREKEQYSWDDVADVTFSGYITFLDIPKKTAKAALQQLQALNVQIKVVTGDNEIVTKKICEEVGMDITKSLVGTTIEHMSDDALKHVVNTTDIFARMTPLQKLRVVKALQANGHTVGYLGDGINDLPALHNADVGISVNTAVDVAKDAASVVLLRKGIDVINDGIREGRKTFTNTIKYILMSTSSNFGNMFSAAGASFLLPFLPMTPLQILLTNGLYDISQMTIPSDNVDPESLLKPRHWNLAFVKSYMLFFGPLSSVYDFLTFSILLFLFHARGALFQTGWFIESLATEILVVFVIRTSKTPFYKSRPSKWLAITSLSIVGIGLLLPFTPLASSLGLVVPPPLYFAILIVLTTTYLLLMELVKSTFLKKFNL